ncbi:DNA-processing protein DprA [Bifidobacterium bombi]|uniref:DNA recombination-mediator protein A n=1 Tax=Bifidobacterium bombi DSM 19703 TaxID=1341695 RepID=A0A080N5P8_9BIFI|nr:DNA-processing protein DprA [Bifidobacterium bombi]KFF30874.1 DNA recombination-mediator protein A [Bifidobacterium bombi DSM 19703]
MQTEQRKQMKNAPDSVILTNQRHDNANRCGRQACMTRVDSLQNRKADVPTRLGIDEDTLARAVLTFCIDGADALMYATIKGSENAMQTLELISLANNDERNSSSQCLDRTFATGTARWGRKVNSQGMKAFHRALQRWQSRFRQLPSYDPQSLIDWLTESGRLWIIGPSSHLWPRQLDDLAIRSQWAPPLCLWGYGDASALTSCPKPIGIVGSRGVDEYGRYVARNIAEHAAEAGHLVVSGGAYGADAAAHWGALESRTRLGAENSGKTVSIFAGGLDHVGPERNKGLFEQITASGGALLSELCPDTIPEARRFLLRNRIIAALSSTVVVAQARIRSGALNTASWACELGREVYAAPGDINTPHNTGCNHLISENRAMLLTSAHDVNQICHSPHKPITMTWATTSEARESPAENMYAVKNHTTEEKRVTAPKSRDCTDSGTRISERYAARTTHGLDSMTPHTDEHGSFECGKARKGAVDGERTAQRPCRIECSEDVESVGSMNERNPHHQRQEELLTAIRQCGKAGIIANHDNVLRMLNERTTPKGPASRTRNARWDVYGMNEILGELELLGMLETRRGCLRIVSSPTAATDNGRDLPRIHPDLGSCADSEGQ